MYKCIRICTFKHSIIHHVLQITKYSVAVLLLFLIMGASSCGLFKGKNKCGDCPAFGQKELPADNKKVINV